MQSLIATVVMFVLAGTTMCACPTCTPAERSFIDDMTHGTTPQNAAEYVIVALFIIFLTGSLYLAIRAYRKDAAHELTN